MSSVRGQLSLPSPIDLRRAEWNEAPAGVVAVLRSLAGRASVARCDGLTLLQAVDPDIPHRTEGPALITGAHALAAIFEHFDTMLSCNGEDAIHVRGVAL